MAGRIIHKTLIIAPAYCEDAWMISAKRTAEALASKGEDVTVVTSRVGNYPRFELVNGVKVVRLNSYFVPDPFNSVIVPSIFSWIKRHHRDFDTFIINKYMFFTSLVAPFLRMLGRRNIIVQTDTFPGVNWFHPSSRILNFGMWLYARTLGRLVLSSAKKVVILHPGNSSVCRRWGLNCKTIFNGVDTLEHIRSEPAKDILDLKRDFVISWVGRLDKVKGYQLFLDIATEVHRYLPHTRFVMVCGNKYPSLRHRLAAKYPFVDFYGYRHDIPNVLRASDIYLLTSYSEGLPNTVLEAMASGVPVISTNVGGVSWLIDDCVNGYITSRRVSSFLQLIMYLINNPSYRRLMGCKAQIKAKDEFDLDIVANSWVSLIRGGGDKNSVYYPSL